MANRRHSIAFRRSTPLMLALVFAAALTATPDAASAQDDRWVGDWQGELDAGPQGKLPIIFHITAGESGLSATMDSPAQGAFAIPMDGVTISGDSVAITLNAAQARYDGVMQEDGTISGTWSQGPAELTLDLAKSEGGEGASAPSVPDAASRPQTPKEPLPYATEDLVFPHGSGDFELAGTLSFPEGEGPFPAAVLVSGSGPQDRDETLLGHKPFAVLADHLTRAGIAVLRYDDRGVARSGGVFATATSVDLSTDAEAAVTYLRGRPEIDGGAIGIIGHSEGGLIAPMVAARNDAVAYAVLLAGPGTTGEEILIDQNRLIAAASGVAEGQIERGLEVNRRLFQVIRDKGPAESAPLLREILVTSAETLTEGERAAAGIDMNNLDAWVMAQVNQINSPWFRFFLTYDPTDALEHTRVPVLALNGELDLQVPWEQNLAGIEAALTRAGNTDFTLHALPGLNHLFQNAETGSPAEYATIEETMSPQVLELVSDWILERFAGR